MKPGPCDSTYVAAFEVGTEPAQLVNVRPLTVVRIYFDSMRALPGRTRFLEWIRRPISTTRLARAALKSGISYGMVTSGDIGFTPCSSDVYINGLETPSDRRVTCLELVAPEALIAYFLATHHEVLQRATVVRMTGMQVTLPPEAAASTDVQLEDQR